MERSEHPSNRAVIISSSLLSPWSEQALLPTIERGGSGMELFVISLLGSPAIEVDRWEQQ